jgi:acetyl esterase/lipase
MNKRPALPWIWSLAQSIFFFLIVCLFTGGTLTADEARPSIKIEKNLSYKTGNDLSDYEKERCHLDLYLPAGKQHFATLVWFHGGGLTGGNKEDKTTIAIARSLAEAGIAVATVNYRLSPKAAYPAYVEDAAASFAWVHEHISKYGGDTNRVFVGGHSAGGYLTSMIVMDPDFLKKYGLSQTAIAGAIPVSGQTMTHFTVRAERKISNFQLVADEAAPIHYTRKDAPPLLVIYAEKDMPTRAEENHFFVSAMKAAGDSEIHEMQIPGRDHGNVIAKIPDAGDPVREAILKFINREGRS